MQIDLLKISFDHQLNSAQLSQFRGAVINLSGNNPIFHNHLGGGYRYDYPKIQYKLVNSCPAILGINEGVNALRDIFDGRDIFYCRLGRELIELPISSSPEWSEDVRLVEDMHTYLIENWLPLNERNYSEYINAGGMVSQIAMLRRILVGNILSFAKGIGFFFDAQVECELKEIRCDGGVEYKGIDLLRFSGIFQSNVLLPNWIGLGKSASLNHGTIIRL